MLYMYILIQLTKKHNIYSDRRKKSLLNIKGIISSIFNKVCTSTYNLRGAVLGTVKETY